jgi:hypothetical protein
MILSDEVKCFPQAAGIKTGIQPAAFMACTVIFPRGVT